MSKNGKENEHVNHVMVQFGSKESYSPTNSWQTWRSPKLSNSNM